jgi:hypothetical protein
VSYKSLSGNVRRPGTPRAQLSLSTRVNAAPGEALSLRDDASFFHFHREVPKMPLGAWMTCGAHALLERSPMRDDVAIDLGGAS